MRARISRLLSYARELQRAASFEDLLLVTRDELARSLGYTHAWLFVADDENADCVRLIDIAGSKRDAAWEAAPVSSIRGDPILEQVFSSDVPVVVEDARSDPRTDKEIVERLGNRTIVTVPLCSLDKPFGAFGTGTFGDEGCRVPSPEQLSYLVGMAGELAIAAGRIRLLEGRRRSEQALRRAEEQLRRVHELEAMGRLAGSVAHDFNNLLSVILSYSELLLREPELTEPARADIRTIQKAGLRAAELTRQLLTFSRQQPLAPRVLDLNAVISESELLLTRLLGANIELVTQQAPELCSVKADPLQLGQLMTNLVLNARDAMPKGGKLTIETKNVQLDASHAREHVDMVPGSYAMLTVSDTGTGMDATTRSRIFEPFFTTKQPGKGTGLGLATVFGIVKQSGGNIWVRSELGLGTTFEVYFPEASSALEQPLAH